MNSTLSKKESSLRGNKLLITICWLSALFVFLAGLQGCTDPVKVGSDFLDKPPSAGMTKDTVFAKVSTAERFLWNAYRTLPFGPRGIGDALASITDINHVLTSGSEAPSRYYNNNLSPTSIKRWGIYNYYHGSVWDGVRDANIFIENVDDVPDMDKVTKRRLKAEARMVIAVHYTQLFRFYGGVPWINHAFSPNEELKQERMTAKATVDSTVAIIDEAIPHLPFELDNLATDAGRFTQAGAMGLKARLLLFAASPLFNANQPYLDGEAADHKMVWFGGYDADLWQEAADAAKELIDKVEQTGAYELVDMGNPRQDFQDAYFDRGSSEMLISTRRDHKKKVFPPNNYLGTGRFTTTHNYVQMFPMANGMQIDEPGSGYDPSNPYENRDPRLYETVVVNGDEYQGRIAELWIGGRERVTQQTNATGTGYRGRKFMLDITSAEGVPTQFPYLRLPEIYLSYAEALNEINGGPTPEAYEYVNRVRNRVDLGDLPAGLSQEEFREAVLRERALEFGYEEVRWFDIIRWKKEEIFKKPLHGVDITRNNDGTFNYNRWELPARAWKDDFSPKWYLSPFSRDEMLKGYLVQNPGW